MKIFLRLFLALFLVAAPLGQVSRAFAQQGGTVTISAPETGSFPKIQFRMDAYDAQGIFISSLKTENVLVMEDGQALKPVGVEKIQNGLQVIVVLNLGQVMSKQFNGIPGYQIIQKALADWARGQTANNATTAADDFSLATPTGLFLIRERDPNQVVKALNDYKPDLAHAQPALGSLAEALDLATDPLDQPSMKRAILYITPPLPASSDAAFADLSKRAQGTGVKVNIWQVADGIVKNGSASQANPYEQMAQSTGGHYQEINLANPLPEIEPLFQPLRQTYYITYTSTIQKSGAHQVSAQITQEQGKVSSNESSFGLTVQPPNPIFLSPPATIQRYWTGKDATAALTPEKVGLQIMIEFPDQHRRALKATRLYVNDKLVAENKAEPFDRFSLPITDITTSTKEMLRVEAIDVLNLSGSSIEIAVEITIDQPAKASLSDRISPRGIVAVASVTAAGVFLALVLVLTSSQRRAKRKRQQADKRLMKDPVTQPVLIRQEDSRPAKGKPSGEKTPPTGARAGGAWSSAIWSRASGQGAPARLIALDENEQPVTGGAIPLSRQEITFGRDPQRATQVLDSPTVNELHARLYRSAEGSFILADQGSIAGTWINYAPITSSGARLEHGDLIHIGRVMFRFELANPTPAEIKVTSLDQSP